MSQYEENYFKTLNYSNYLERKQKYFRTAFEIADLLNKLTLINKNTKILDFGCAVGFLMAGLRELGYTNIIGCDVSDWARKYGQENFGNTIYSSIDEVPDDINLMFALDVFEHMKDEEISNILEKVKFPNLIVRIPSSVDGETFHLEVSRRDPTHINCKTKEQWISFFEKMGYKSIVKLNLFSIYDSDGVSCFLVFR